MRRIFFYLKKSTWWQFGLELQVEIPSWFENHFDKWEMQHFYLKLAEYYNIILQSIGFEDLAFFDGLLLNTFGKIL